MPVLEGIDGFFQRALCDFTLNSSSSRLSGYTDDVDKLLKNVQSIGYSFCVRTSRNYAREGSEQPIRTSHPKIPCVGTAFTILGTTTYQCSQGPKYYNTHHPRTLNETNEHENPKPKRSRLMDTKKLNCPVTLEVIRIECYPDFPVTSGMSIRSVAKVVKELREALKTLKSGNLPQKTLRNYIQASTQDQHTHTKDAAQVKLQIHRDLLAELHKFVGEGITSTRDIKLLLEQYVEQRFQGESKPERHNAAFYPSSTTIYNHVHRVSCKLNKSENKTDQESIAIRISPYSAKEQDGSSNENESEGTSKENEEYLLTTEPPIGDCSASVIILNQQSPESIPSESAQNSVEVFQMLLREELNTCINQLQMCSDIKVLENTLRTVKEARISLEQSLCSPFEGDPQKINLVSPSTDNYSNPIRLKYKALPSRCRIIKEIINT